MLIHSHRHTPADLLLWGEYEIGDAAHAETSSFRAKVDKSIQCLVDFARGGDCYAGISWGKDSTVLAHLLVEAGVSVPTMWVRVEPIKSPECCQVRDDFFASHSRARLHYHEIEVWCDRRDGEWHATNTLEAGVEAFKLKVPANRRILGIRADESGVRGLTCWRNGMSSATSCRPLAWWNADDVMAYLYVNGLPVHPAYACLGGGRWDRSRLRVASLGGRRGDGSGRREWEQEYYGTEIRRLDHLARAVGNTNLT